ncbi:AraC family transcriptional regulator [Puteibacter caeruleilacunae]|nr:AraC family transcriptional regulator [Puteibacter caeruleilacunae]
MNHNEAGDLINISLKSIALSRFDTNREYPYVISPFSRMYLITEGEGWIILNDKKIALEPNYLYLIPSFTPCSYFFTKNLEHYYVHFSTSLLNGLNIYNLYDINHKVKSCHLDQHLFSRLLNINPDLELPHPDPDIYQTKLWLNKENSYSSPALSIESRGIMEQLLSRFIISDNHGFSNATARYNIQPILAYIQENLKEAIQIETLANMSCLSKDHFTRVFKSIVLTTPSDYIISKRIEKAKFLLLTTDLPLKKIFEETGFKSLPYFSRIFKKHTQMTPLAYRRMGI